MKSNDVLCLLGISQRAGKLISGQDSVERAAMAKKVFLIIVSNDASQNTKKKMESLSIKTNIPIYYWAQSDELGKAIGKEQRKVIGITDKGIAKKFKDALIF